MFLLNKVIQLREKSSPEQEKPFLEHLEDLRKMLFRVVITLLIAVLGCFGFQKTLMEILRRPVEQVWIGSQEQKLPQQDSGAPKPVSVETWEQAKTLERAVAGLPESAREGFYARLGDDMAFHVKSVSLLRAAKSLPEASRKEFLDGLGIDDAMRRQVDALLLTGPGTEPEQRGNLRMMSALKPTESFMLSMKLALYAGVIVSFPLLLFFVLQFVLPGLHAHEKRVMWPAMAVGFGLFLSGVFFAYFEVLPRALAFFQAWGDDLGVSNDWRIGDYISFATQFTLLFGLSFELPVVVMVLVKLGLLSYETMAKTRSHAVVAIFIAAAIITPTPDIPTMLLMAGPMVLLYEICIWLAWFDRRKNRMREEEEAREDEERRLARIGSDDAQARGDADPTASGVGETGPPAPRIRPAADVSYQDESCLDDADASDGKNPMDPYLADPDYVDESGDDGFHPDAGSQDFPETGETPEPLEDANHPEPPAKPHHRED